MDDYTRLLNELNSYFDLDDIEMSSEYISAYDLYTILNEKFGQLRNVVLGVEFESKINADRTIIKTIGRFFHKKTETVLEKECICVHSNTKGTTAEIGFIFADSNKSLHIYRDFDSEEIYFDKFNQDRDFVIKYYDDIDVYFNTLEVFSKLLACDINKHDSPNCEQIFSDSFMKIKLIYDNKGCMYTDISIVESEDPNNIFNREWLNREKLADVVNERKEDFLKKIPINVNELNQTCKTIIEPYLVKEKILQKK